MSLNGERSPLEPGYRLDRYELLCPIAHGGMASVWLARLHGKHGFEKLVAVKSILPQYASDLRFQQMFLDEARIASGIEHANVAQILDLGESHEVLYLVMEWVDGDSLSKLHRAVERRGQRMPLGVVLRILADTCGGLHAAHELRDKGGRLLGVVHRDISPQNVLVSTNGTAKLIDFGIAKARDRVAGDTSTGFLKGKIQYMAPEQAVGRPVDRRADVWAVGAVLYYLLTGLPPYDGPNQLATLHMLTSGELPPPLPDEYPSELNDLCMRAMSHDPERRVPTAMELQRALEHVMMRTGHVTTTHDVAAFVAEHLGDRTAARRNAVDLALQAAEERQRVKGRLDSAAHDSSASGSGTERHLVDVGPDGAPLPHASPSAAPGGDGRPSQPGMRHSRPGGALAGTSHAVAAASGSGWPGPLPRNRTPVPPAFGMPGAPGDPEQPISQVSSATLGSAAVVYPPFGASGPRKLWAVAAGVLGAAVIVGVIALVSVVLKRAHHPADVTDTSAAVAPTNAETTTTTTTADTPRADIPPVASDTAPTAAATNAPPPTAPTATAALEATPAANVAAPAQTSRVTAAATAGASHGGGSHGSSAPAHTTPTHPVPAPTKTTRDYGF